jgi:hypothetical protein
MSPHFPRSGWPAADHERPGGPAAVQGREVFEWRRADHAGVYLDERHPPYEGPP